ncbi:MAG TPA: SDR family NAD(P)-dependent oxidoreductase [Rubrivivax sp.]|nr:SDR family NAD(P)-dependent oxidoreductase [Rubrivivax sp.]
MRLGLQDKVAIVTGSGRGIGAESAQAVSEEGARLVITGIDQQAAAERCAALRRNGFPAIAVTAGVTRGADLERLVHSTPDAFGGVHVPANNAGFARNASITRFGDSDWHAVVPSALSAARHEGSRALLRCEADPPCRANLHITNVRLHGHPPTACVTPEPWDRTLLSARRTLGVGPGRVGNCIRQPHTCLTLD